VLGAGVAGTLGAGAVGADTHNDTTTVTYKGAPIPFARMTYMPRLACPADHPYVLNKQYNTNTSFRLWRGIEFTDWSWGFDASVVNQNYNYLIGDSPRGKVYTGLKGNHDAYSSASYNWVDPPQSNWTLTLHCTSDANKAARKVVYNPDPPLP
jgi:hypothetical protein